VNLRFRRLLPIAAAVVLTLSPQAATAAGPAPAHLTVDAGDAGAFIPGRPLPVRVRVDSDVLIAGQLVVTAGSSQVAEPVQIAGGSSQQFELVVPTGLGQNQVQVQVALTERGTRLIGVAANVNAAPDTEIVGLLPGLLAGQPVPGPAPLSIDAGTARFVALTDQDLASAPGSLGPLSAVGLGPDGLGSLSPGAREALLAWTASGGRLLIDAAPDQAVAGLPPAWQAPGARRVAAGRGQVTLTGGAMAAGRWAGLVDPAGHAPESSAAFANQSFTLSTALATDAGLTTLKLPWLIIFLVVYIVVVGPVSFIVLRRRRRVELLWIVIPIIAAVFAGSSYFVGSAERAGVRIVHGTVIDTTVGGGAAVSYVGISSGAETTARVSAPSGWTLDRYAEPNSSPLPGNGQLTSALVDTGIDGRLNLNAGQFAIVRTSGPARFAGQLTVTATSSADGQAQGTVTNATAFTLHDVSVLIGDAGTDVGTLAAGATAPWSATAAIGAGAASFQEQQLWGTSSLGNGSGPIFAGPGPFGPNGPFPGPPITPSPTTSGGSPASLPVWESAPSGLAPGTRSTGVAVAVGWTDRYQPPVVIAGHGKPATGPTAIVGTAAVHAGASVGDLAIARQVVRGDVNAAEVGPGIFVTQPMGGSPTIVGWTVPAAAAGHSLALTIPAGTGDLTVWSGTAWRNLAAVPSADGAGSTTTTIPGTTIPLQGGPVPATVAPAFALPQPFPLPQPQFGPFGLQGPSSEAALRPDDVHGGVVYIRIAASGVGRPFNLDAVSLKVLP
jgi:hypothetical protein